jgi:hypothetical protein
MCKWVYAVKPPSRHQSYRTFYSTVAAAYEDTNIAYETNLNMEQNTMGGWFLWTHGAWRVGCSMEQDEASAMIRAQRYQHSDTEYEAKGPCVTVQYTSPWTNDQVKYRYTLHASVSKAQDMDPLLVGGYVHQLHYPSMRTVTLVGSVENRLSGKTRLRVGGMWWWRPWGTWISKYLPTVKAGEEPGAYCKCSLNSDGQVEVGLAAWTLGTVPRVGVRVGLGIGQFKGGVLGARLGGEFVVAG